jgi:uncharacterized protein
MGGLPDHLQALRYPRAYPHAVGTVELIETHVSWVLLTGEFAYKIKRPVRYAFVDMRSAAHRAFLCHEEVRLNRRFAPEIYLGVCPISAPQGEARIDGPGPAIEHAVKMRQFSREEELDRLLESGRVASAELESFGRELARVHAELPVPRPGQDWGRPESLRSLVLRNAEECARVAGPSGPAELAPLTAALRTRLDAALALLSQRFAAGRVRECHGDLHARNVVRRAGRLLAFDCLEFDPALRWTDVADEIAFLAADLEARQRPQHAHAFLAGYLGESGDWQACALLPLFRAHRALVRAKVVALEALEAPVARRAELERQHAAYLDCARRALGSRPARLVLMCGLSGSGKSWLAQQLAPRLPALHLRSDIERRRLAGLEPAARTGSAVAQGLYSADMTRRVYARLEECAAAMLAGGYDAIIDASFGRREDRARLYGLAARLGAPVCLVHCRAPRAVLEARIAARQRRGSDPSEADLAVLTWQAERFEPPQPQETGTLIEIESAAAGAVDELVRRISALSA